MNEQETDYETALRKRLIARIVEYRSEDVRQIQSLPRWKTQEKIGILTVCLMNNCRSLPTYLSFFGFSPCALASLFLLGRSGCGFGFHNV